MGLVGTFFLKMKKIALLPFLLCVSSIVSAQTSRYDVNIYTNPFRGVEYTRPMGSAYQQMMNMYQQSDRNAIERKMLQMERERMQQEHLMEMSRASAAANAEGKEIVSDEILTLNGINLATKVNNPIRLRVIKRKNGSINMTCMGIKRGNTWDSCSKSIESLQELYNIATSEEDRAMVLSLMDFGNYLLDTDTEIYIIK